MNYSLILLKGVKNMRIAYLDIIYDDTNSFEELAHELNKHAPSGVTVDYHFVTGTDNLEYIAFENMVLHSIVLKINELRKLNYDAVIIGCFHDPAIDAAREMFDDIIIAGPGESAVQIASVLGKRYSLISVREKTTSKMLENIRNVGLIAKLASVRPLNIRVSELQKNHEFLLKRMNEEIEKAIMEDNADVIVLACTMETGQYRKLQEKFNVPVIDPSIAAMMHAIMQYNCRKYCNWTYSKKYTYEQPPKSEIERYLNIML